MKRFLPLLLIASAALAGCQQSPEQATEQTAPEAKPGMSLTAGKLVLPAVKGNPGAVYFSLRNGGDKPVVLAAIAIDGAGRAELHETVGGKMTPINQLEIAPGSEVKFEAGGKHGMAFELSDTLAPGGSAEATLIFADGDKLSAPLTIEARGAGGGGHGH